MTIRHRLPGTPEPMLMLPGADGLQIAADRWGNETNPVVILLHGGGQTRHAWKGTGEALAKAGMRTYSLDARGHGDSDWSASSDYEQSAMVDDLVEVARSLGNPRPVLVGASMGGGVALCAVGERRINARALVLVDMAPQIEREGAQKILDFMALKPEGFDSLEDVADAVASYQPHRKRPRVLDGLKKNVRLDENGRIRWQLPAGPATAVLAGGAAPAVTDRLVIFPFGSGELVATLRLSGVRVWGTTVAGQRRGVAYNNLNDITGDPVIVGNTLYAGNQSGRVVAMEASSGERLWTAQDGAYSPVLPVGGSIFFVSDRNELIRLDAETGARIWGTELPLYTRERERRRQAVFTHFGPILAGGHLVVASGDGNIRFFDPESGAETGSLPIRGGAASHPIVVNGTLYVVSGDGRLHAFR